LGNSTFLVAPIAFADRVVVLREFGVHTEVLTGLVGLAALRVETTIPDMLCHRIVAKFGVLFAACGSGLWRIPLGTPPQRIHTANVTNLLNDIPDRLLFLSIDDGGTSLWQTDGATTTRLTELATPFGSMVTVAGQTFIVGLDIGVARLDGDALVRVHDLPSALAPYPVADQVFLFSANEGGDANLLWRSDGVRLAHHAGELGLNAPSEFATLGERVYCLALLHPLQTRSLFSAAISDVIF
jgi:hypothetical protein